MKELHATGKVVLHCCGEVMLDKVVRNLDRNCMMLVSTCWPFWYTKVRCWRVPRTDEMSHVDRVSVVRINMTFPMACNHLS